MEHGRAQALDLLESVPNITLERNNITQTLLNVYKSRDLSNKFVNFVLKDELAQDMDGVKREIYSIFWEEITCLYFEGGNSFVPRVGPDITDDLCKSLGRVLIHCFLLTRIIPIQLSKAFLIAVIAGEEWLNDQDFLDAFLEYALDYEAAVLQKALQEAKTGKLEVATQRETLEILSLYGVRTLPTHENLKSLLISTARCELVQKVNRAIGKFREGVLEMGSQIIANASKDDVLQLYANLHPTSVKMLSLVKPDVDGELTKLEEEVYQHFRRYICAADSGTLKRLLRFITGSHYLVTSEIKVIFHLSIGNIPCFVVHTCSCIVDLAVGGYLGFADFKSQLDSILSNPESWKFYLV